MRRRDIIRLLGGTALWPLAAQAKQTERIRRVGVLLNRAANDPEGQARLVVFHQALQQLGWTDGGNVRIDIRWGEDNVDSHRRYAAELVALAPDVILASGTLSVTALQNVSHTLPIVFVGVVDAVGAGVVTNQAHPSGNVTGFTIYEYSLGGKWLELLKQIAPNVTRVAVLRDPINPSGIAMFGAIRASAPSLGIEVSPVSVQDAGEIERGIATFARAQSSGLIVTASASASVHRDLILGLAAQYKMPAIYYRRYFVDKGGLMSYSHDDLQQYRDAANYIDRILKGEKPGDLPVQAPTKYELIINLRTAKALGLPIPQPLLAAAGEVIE